MRLQLCLVPSWSSSLQQGALRTAGFPRRRDICHLTLRVTAYSSPGCSSRQEGEGAGPLPFGFWVYLPVGEEVGEEDQTLRLPPVGSSWAGSTLPEAPPLQVLTPPTLWLLTASSCPGGVVSSLHPPFVTHLSPI